MAGFFKRLSLYIFIKIEVVFMPYLEPFCGIAKQICAGNKGGNPNEYLSLKKWFFTTRQLAPKLQSAKIVSFPHYF